jgi:iron-sulfur cluster insertion protein
MNFTVTDRAVTEVKRILAEQEVKEEKVYLRLRVQGGGCSGFQHKLDLDSTFNEKMDIAGELNGINIVVDKRSSLYTEGAIVDFSDDLNRRGFVVSNPGAKATCGCGSSFSL